MAVVVRMPGDIPRCGSCVCIGVIDAHIFDTDAKDIMELRRNEFKLVLGFGVWNSRARKVSFDNDFFVDMLTYPRLLLAMIT